VRRSLGMSHNPVIERDDKEEDAEKEWQYLLGEDRELRLERARQFRQSGRVEP